MNFIGCYGDVGGTDMKVSDGEVKPRHFPRHPSLTLPLRATLFHTIHHFYIDVSMLLKSLCIRH